MRSDGRIKPRFARFVDDAERILEKVMKRRNWQAATRDALAEQIELIVEREDGLRRTME